MSLTGVVPSSFVGWMHYFPPLLWLVPSKKGFFYLTFDEMHHYWLSKMSRETHFAYHSSWNYFSPPLSWILLETFNLKCFLLVFPLVTLFPKIIFTTFDVGCRCFTSYCYHSNVTPPLLLPLLASSLNFYISNAATLQNWSPGVWHCLVQLLTHQILMDRCIDKVPLAPHLPSVHLFLPSDHKDFL